MLFDPKIFELILAQELGDQNQLTPQEVYELGHIYKLKYPRVLKADLGDLIDFMLQFGFISLDRKQASAILIIYLLTKALGLRTSRGKRVTFKDFCFDLLKATDKAIFNLAREYRQVENEIQSQDLENIRTLDELLKRKDQLEAEMRDAKLDNAIHLKRQAELMAKEAELKRSVANLVAENKRASSELKLMDDLKLWITNF